MAVRTEGGDRMVRMRDGLDIRVDEPATGLVVVRVAGEIDILGAPLLRQCVDDRLPGACAFVLDLSGVTFFGAAGISVLVEASAAAERLRVNWALACPPAVLRPLQVTDLARRLPVCSEFPEAVRVATAASPVLS